jgi:hypothetical protein
MQDYATRADILIPEVVNLRSDSTMTEARGQKDNKKIMIDQQDTTKN